MPESLNRLKLSIAFFFLLIGGFLLISPKSVESVFFSVLSILAVIIGIALLLNVLRNFSRLSHPIFTCIVGAAMAGMGLFFLIKDVDPGFSAIIMGGLAIILALERLQAYETRKGKKEANVPLIYCIIYWIFAVFLTKSLGEHDINTLIMVSGTFFLASGLMWLLSILYFHDA